jgi:glutathione synthase/RimK-type ligase-like ATP-grasp enzyme
LPLNIAVQMDPIEKIKIGGDSTFALLLEAQKRGHKLSYFTPDKLSMLDGRIVANAQQLTVRDKDGDHSRSVCPSAQRCRASTSFCSGRIHRSISRTSRLRTYSSESIQRRS